MINRQHKSDAEYIAEMKNAWGTQLDPYILTIRSLKNKFERLCAQLDKLEEQQKAHATLKSEHRRLLEDRRFWFEECDRIKAKLGELKERFDAEKSERVRFEQENAKHQQQRNALRVSLEDALKENARLTVQLNKKDREIRLVKVERDREKSSRELYYSLYESWSKEAVALKARLLPQSSSTATGRATRGPTGWVLHAKQPPKSLSLQQLIEGHAESIRQSVEGFPPWVQELKVKEQLGFFEPILEDYPECPKTC